MELEIKKILSEEEVEELQEEREELQSQLDDYKEKLDELEDLDYTPSGLEEAYSIMEVGRCDYEWGTRETLFYWVQDHLNDEYDLETIRSQLIDLDLDSEYFRIDGYGNYQNPNGDIDDEIEGFIDTVKLSIEDCENKIEKINQLLYDYE